MKIDQFCKSYNLGHVKNIVPLKGGLIHQVYKVETENKTYVIKILNPEIMSRRDAYDNFIVSEHISNLAKINNINVSCALMINNSYLNMYGDNYYIVYDFVEGKSLSDEKITIEHCEKIGYILSQIHSLGYNSLSKKLTNEKKYEMYNWEEFIHHINFNNMPYKELYLQNYQKYYSLIERVNERFNNIIEYYAIVHNDLDPKNVLWNKSDAIIIDWEAANVGNPYRELLEVALSWSGFLSDNFNKEKFVAVINSYNKNKKLNCVDWYSIICGNLVYRFEWLYYNIKRSLGIITKNKDEMALAENEVSKTINEINRYLDLIGTLYDILFKNTLNTNKNEKYIQKIIDNNDIFKGKNYELITAGFTNTIYKIDNYIIRICTDINNEKEFMNDINFYLQNSENPYIPKLYVSDTSKNIVPYYYEILEKVEGETLYEIWYKKTPQERKDIIVELINAIKKIHSIKVKEYDFKKYIKTKISKLIKECNLDENIFKTLLEKCDVYFKENKFGLIHGDLHFDNIIFNRGKITMLDFECSMAAPIDYDLKIFSRCIEKPWLWASEKSDMLTTEVDYQGLLDLFIENYVELQNIPYLQERLKMYNIIETLEEYKNTRDKKLLDEIKQKIKLLGCD